MDLFSAVRAVFGFLLVFIIPGLAWSFFFFKQLKVVERISLSFALSLVFVTLTLIAANKFANIKITALNSLLIIIAVTALPIGIHYLGKVITRRRTNTG